MKKVIFATLFIIFTVVACDGDFPTEYAGLEWSHSSSDRMNWQEATEYCEDIGGRLPTISEIRKLIQNCPATETGGECKVTDDCLSSDECYNHQCYGCEYDYGYDGIYSVFGGSSNMWSSSSDLSNSDNAWMVYFDYANVVYENKKNIISFRCVR